MDIRRRVPIAQIAQLAFVLTLIQEYESANAPAGQFFGLIAVDEADKNSNYPYMNGNFEFNICRQCGWCYYEEADNDGKNNP